MNQVIGKMNKAMGKVLVCNKFLLKLCHSVEVPFSLKKKSVVTTQNSQSIKTFLTPKLSQHHKSGIFHVAHFPKAE